jgi:hypothetical protein
MAYLQFETGFAGGAGSVAQARTLFPLSALERQTVLLSRGDRVSSVRKPGRAGRMLRALFGFEPVRGLADPKLEALRRYAVMYRAKRQALSEHEHQTLVAAGFTTAQAASARSLVDRMHVRVGLDRGQVALAALYLVMLAAVLVVADRWLTWLIEDRLAALIILGAVTATFAPALSGRATRVR